MDVNGLCYGGLKKPNKQYQLIMCLTSFLWWKMNTPALQFFYVSL